MKNWQVAEFGSFVRAMAMVPRTLDRPLPDSFLIGAVFALVFLPHLVGHATALNMKPGMTRWKMRLS